MPKYLNDIQKRAFANVEPEGVPSLDVIKQRFSTAFDEMTPDFIKGNGQSNPVVPKTPGQFEYESDKNVLGNQKPMMGEYDTGGMSTEEVQKAQEAEKKKMALEQYAAQQKAIQMPPMEVPKSRAETMEPRLQNPENYKRFQEMVQKIKQNK